MVIRVNSDGEWISDIAKHLGDEKNLLTKSLQVKPGDLVLLAAGEKDIPSLVLGRYRPIH